jgi:beta-carotene hydroxylase
MFQRGLWSRKPALLAEHAITVAIQVGVVAGLGMAGYLREALVLWVLPVAVSGAVLELTVAWLVHYPHESQHPLENTRMFPGRILQVLTLNQNYHLVHHLWMSIPWFRYPRASGLAEQSLRQHEGSVSV